jgi:hypothetical protein
MVCFRGCTHLCLNEVCRKPGDLQRHTVAHSLACDLRFKIRTQRAKRKEVGIALLLRVLMIL